MGTQICTKSKMRKTRLVILPTKCLNQMGFLLLFLSCPVIGDWGRIRPESENSHNAIQIEREGTCGLDRDPPGGLLDFLNETGSKQCRISEDSDLNKPAEKPAFEEPVSIKRSDQKRVYVRRLNQRESERRTIEREPKRELRGVRRGIRSRSVESRRLNNRNNLRVRFLSLSRLEGERTMRDRSARRHGEGNKWKETRRLYMTTQNERRVGQQRNLNRELSRERRENKRDELNAAERSERETRRFTRFTERETKDIGRDNNRRSFQGFLTRRENSIIRNQNRERAEKIQERSERRLSFARRELQDAKKEERNENRRSSNRIKLERRLPEIRKARSLEFVAKERSVRINRNSGNSWDANDRRFESLSPKESERNVRERRVGLLNERMDSKARRVNVAAVRELNFGNKKSEDEKFFEEDWMDFKSYEGFKTGDWTTNCIIGAVVYFFTTRQKKTV